MSRIVSRMCPRLLAVVVAASLWVAVGGISAGGDWPQILGPGRDGRAAGEQLAAWGEDGPQVEWTYKVGAGYAGCAVVGQRVVIFHRYDETDRVEALNADNGERIWKADFRAKYAGGINPDTGPRCVPLVHKGRVYVFSAGGDLHCVALDSGEKKWSRGVYDDLRGNEGYFGAGSTPIVADDKLLLNVGGRNGAGLAAFSLDDGKIIWKKTDEGASYSSPTLAKIDGQSHVIFLTRLNVVSVNPASGAERFRFPFGRTGPTVNAATPLVIDDHVFVSASYGVGAELRKINRTGTESVWASDDVMSSQYTTCVHRGGYLYGVDGREDSGRPTLRCIEAMTGKVQWSVAGFGVAHVILSGDKLLIQKVDGQLVLAEASPKQYRKLASADVFDDVTRAMPALSNGRLYVRDTSRLKCILVGKGR